MMTKAAAKATLSKRMIEAVYGVKPVDHRVRDLLIGGLVGRETGLLSGAGIGAARTKGALVDNLGGILDTAAMGGRIGAVGGAAIGGGVSHMRLKKSMAAYRRRRNLTNAGLGTAGAGGLAAAYAASKRRK